MKHFDWHVGDFEPEETLEPKRSSRPRLIGIGLALVLILAGLAVWGWQRSDERQVRAQVERSQTPRGAEADQPVGNPPQVRATDFRGNLATVEVIIPDPQIEAYSLRQTWFYRYSGNAWERVPPDLSLWGGERETETEHFRFIYNELDHETVAGLADEVESLYADLLVGMGKTGVVKSNRKFTIEIVPEALPGRAMQRDWIRLASPHAQALHPDQSDRDALAWDLAHKLSYELLRETAFMAGVTSPNTRFMLECILPSAIAQHWGTVQPRNEYEGRAYLHELMTWYGWSEVDMSDMGRWPSTGWRKPQYECGTYGDFIVDRFGYEKLGGLVQAADQTYGWQQVIEKGLGIDYDQFQREWRAFVEAEYVPAAAEQSADT